MQPFTAPTKPPTPAKLSFKEAAPFLGVACAAMFDEIDTFSILAPFAYPAKAPTLKMFVVVFASISGATSIVTFSKFTFLTTAPVESLPKKPTFTRDSFFMASAFAAST